MAIKGLGVALKLTFAGNNQLTHLPTYVFGIIVAVCIATQMNYFNKALDTFSTNVYVWRLRSICDEADEASPFAPSFITASTQFITFSSQQQRL